MGPAGDAQAPDIFVLNGQLFRSNIEHFAQNSLPRARIMKHPTTKTKSLCIPPAMAALILAQHNNQPAILWH
jgi:hypothetical protein